ncbi:hypothetical protein HNP82_001594 [Catenibacillus scindens]|uniref:Peptidase n=2 Tax=Catenibacillus scindens TaxID=673271 RepID=A0A7W8H9V7_9FIRM|nr:hypothetical protein [Catenibacillus scindens]
MMAYIGFGYPRFYFDWTYLLVIIGVVLSLWASAGVRSAFNRFSTVATIRGMTGAQAAQHILAQSGIYDVRVIHVRGNLNDHYDPRNKTLALSDPVYSSTSVAAVSVAAHECGHAIQHAGGYLPLKIRGSLVPVANFGAVISWPLILIGILMGFNQTLITVGIVLFTAVVLFHLVTLPVEFNASARGLRILSGSGILMGDENEGAKKVLRAAALTYVASAAGMILQLLRLLILTRGRRRE